jgi:hypothetical protein
VRLVPVGCSLAAARHQARSQHSLVTCVPGIDERLACRRAFAKLASCGAQGRVGGRVKLGEVRVSGLHRRWCCNDAVMLVCCQLLTTADSRAPFLRQPFLHGTPAAC